MRPFPCQLIGSLSIDVFVFSFDEQCSFDVALSQRRSQDSLLLASRSSVGEYPGNEVGVVASSFMQPALGFRAWMCRPEGVTKLN